MWPALLPALIWGEDDRDTAGYTYAVIPHDFGGWDYADGQYPRWFESYIDWGAWVGYGAGPYTWEMR